MSTTYVIRPLGGVLIITNTPTYPPVLTVQAYGRDGKCIAMGRDGKVTAKGR